MTTVAPLVSQRRTRVPARPALNTLNRSPSVCLSETPGLQEQDRWTGGKLFTFLIKMAQTSICYHAVDGWWHKRFSLLLKSKIDYSLILLVVQTSSKDPVSMFMLGYHCFGTRHTFRLPTVFESRQACPQNSDKQHN